MVQTDRFVFSPRTIQRAAQASLFLPGALCLGLRGVRGLFHSHTPSSAAAAIATAARLVALRIKRRTAVLAQVWSVSCRFVMTASSVFFAPQGYTTGFKDHVPT